MNTRKKISQKRQLGSKAVSFIIIANIAAFGVIHYSTTGQKILGSLILYPGNLLKGHFTSLVTSGFIHRDWSHLLLNMLGTFVFGRIVERRFGFGKTLFVYFGALVISMSFSTLFYVFVWHKNIAIIGASGAVMGLCAAAVLIDPFCITYEIILPIPVMVKGWMFFYADLRGFLSGDRDGVSHLAHLMGFLSVAILMYFFSQEDKRILRRGLSINVISFLLFVFLRAWFLKD